MKVLIAEDESGMRYAIVTALKLNGFEADEAVDGQEAVEMSASGAYDCMVFDIMMPRKNGIEALKEIRESGNVTPVIMLTAKAEIEDRVDGLESGADDYLTKPFSMKELIARIRSLMRRQEGAYTRQRLAIGNITLDVEQQELSSHNSIRLAKKETRLLEYLILNEGKELSTDDIYSHVWADEPDIEKDVVWVYISYLREKLHSAGADIIIAGEKDGSFIIEKSA